MDEITLIIRGQEFKASKAKLSEFSDYFRAMFSGSYVENDQKQVNIDVIDPKLMGIILHYFQIGLIDLSDHSLATIEELACAANFLQVTELIKQIQYYLDTNLCVSNWVQILKIAELGAYPELKRLAVLHGLISFKRMRPETIPTIHKLFWYLSHPYLDAETEFDVFKFGHEWIMLNESGGESLLLILCCLDYKRLTYSDLEKMAGLLGENYTNSVAEKVIECLKEHSVVEKECFMSYLAKVKTSICKKYSETVYKELVNLIRSTITRKLEYTPAVPMWVVKDNKPEIVPHCLYTYKQDTGFEKWLEVADKNLWGWSVVSWGLTRVVVACGEHGRGTGAFMKDVKVYDLFKEEWTHHGVNLPSRRHAGLAVIGDSLYMLGGVGGYRVVLDSAIVYDLRQRTFRKIAPLPDAIQSPAACVHNGEIYTCGQKNIYKYENERDRWSIVVTTEIRAHNMISFKGSIYCTQNYFNDFYRVKPGDSKNLELVTQFTMIPTELCHLGNRVIAFTRTMCGHTDVSAVEEFTEKHKVGDRANILWAETDSELQVNDVAGSCVVVLPVPSIDVEISQAHKRYLERFPED